MSRYRNSKIEFTPTPLELKHPVPSDIEIAQAQQPNLKSVATLAEEVGVLPEELELYGNFKAKSAWRFSSASRMSQMGNTLT